MKAHILSLILGASAAIAVAETPVYLNPNAPVEDRIEDALSRMTLAEKVAMCHAQSKFSSAGVPSLGRNKDVLRGEWGFDGVVVTDWGGASDNTPVKTKFKLK